MLRRLRHIGATRARIIGVVVRVRALYGCLRLASYFKSIINMACRDGLSEPWSPSNTAL